MDGCVEWVMFSVLATLQDPEKYPSLSEIGHVLADERTTDDTLGMLLLEQRYLGSAVALKDKSQVTDVGILQFSEYFAKVTDLEITNLPHLTSRGLRAILATMEPATVRSVTLQGCPGVQDYSQLLSFLEASRNLRSLHLGELTVETFDLVLRMLQNTDAKSSLRFLKIENIKLPPPTAGFRVWPRDGVATVALPPVAPPPTEGEEAEPPAEEDEEKRIARIQELLGTFSRPSPAAAAAAVVKRQPGEGLGSLEVQRFSRVREKMQRLLSEEFPELHEVEITSELADVRAAFFAIGERHAQEQRSENDERMARARLNGEIRALLAHRTSK